MVQRTTNEVPMPVQILKLVNKWGKSSRSTQYGDKLAFLNRQKEKYDWDNGELEYTGLIEDTGKVAHAEIPAEIPGVELESDRVDAVKDDDEPVAPSKPSLCQRAKRIRDRFNSSSAPGTGVLNGKTTGVEKTGVTSDETSDYDSDDDSDWDPKQDSHAGTDSDSDSEAFSDSDSDSDDEDSPDGGIEHGAIRTVDNISPDGGVQTGQTKVKPNDEGDISATDYPRADQGRLASDIPTDSANRAETHMDIDTGVDPDDNDSLQHALGSPQRGRGRREWAHRVMYQPGTAEYTTINRQLGHTALLGVANITYRGNKYHLFNRKITVAPGETPGVRQQFSDGVINLGLDSIEQEVGSMSDKDIEEHITGLIMIHHYTLKKGLELYGDKAEKATVKEFTQIHDMDTYTPMDASKLTRE